MERKNVADYNTKLKNTWCPGCGYFGNLTALKQALANLNIPTHQIVLVTGIGCSGRIAGYVNAYGINGLHGRALPTARGVKLARPDLTVIAIGGDGDLFSIGAQHLSHTVRSGVNITVIMFDNHVYALTKGQTSPTTDLGICHIHQKVDCNPPVDPILDMLAFGANSNIFVAQGISSDVAHLVTIIKDGIAYEGFSFINIQSFCVSFNDECWMDEMKGKKFYLEAGKKAILPSGEAWLHDPSDWHLAVKLAKVPLAERPYLGVIYKK